MKTRSKPRNQMLACNHKVKANLLKIDPTRTITLRRSFSARVKGQFDGLKAAILKVIADEDYFGIQDKKPFEPMAFPITKFTSNTRWQFHSSPEKVTAFREWLRGQIKQRITSKQERALWDRYVQAGYQKGAGRAFDDTKKVQRNLAQGDQQHMDFYAGTKDQFLRSAFGRPVAVEKVQLLAARTFSDLEGVTEAMSTEMTRTLADGLVQGKSPFDVARDLVEDVDDIGIDRARLIARTELIRAHAEGQLDALEQMGVEEVGVAVEWSTTQDEKVCPKCQPLEGVVLKLDEARGLLPRHPNCRCAWIPANVGEDDKEQKDTKGGIMGAIAESMAEGDDGWDSDLEIGKGRPQSIFNTGRFSYLLNSFCPTGQGGGVDPSCSPRGSNTQPLPPLGKPIHAPAEDLIALQSAARRLTGEYNFATIHSIHERLGWDRQRFNNALLKSYQDGKLSLRLSEGFKSLTPAERESSFTQAGSNGMVETLAYVSMRG